MQLIFSSQKKQVKNNLRSYIAKNKYSYNYTTTVVGFEDELLEPSRLQGRCRYNYTIFNEKLLLLYHDFNFDIGSRKKWQLLIYSDTITTFFNNYHDLQVFQDRGPLKQNSGQCQCWLTMLINKVSNINSLQTR